uniref:Oxidation resistance protein 1 n=1 Tax=Aplanochytrium stocchinoi TaxID=215587 RepID=A0A7S3PHU7_9STRA|mmetsp:Transcript_618/g.747  ORF Transcript_618/g.747 Transcript_618/m.747 type:complete len:422 (-) Transcript_618:780-2045(-)|eukprot:CAMPEP_0204828722 /NCGR_PEP_ID=MMETSP1346-20131115/6619_1 /ASSEMBLY_ACC=CAM_ASM_000771 /TAXON_ID=215587 /ORGANISM="Aplanochytrium stocchinoi, Strain GSBS06" /LENGTH=421 /DNA_ID=CAMNT_0051958003 /DNA_START=375 /DNA_END=1640 /DNA_ORIENTATION=+
MTVISSGYKIDLDVKVDDRVLKSVTTVESDDDLDKNIGAKLRQEENSIMNVKKKNLFSKLGTLRLMKRLSSLFKENNKKFRRKLKKASKSKPVETSSSVFAEADEPLYPEVIGARQSSILSKEHQRLLMKALPYRKRVCFWQMIYGSDEDGLSLPRMYDSAADEEETLMIIRTVDGDVFGVFVTETWRKHGGRSFYGTGESFVFSCGNVNVSKTEKFPENYFKLYRWTGINECFMSSCESHIAIGAGGEGFAICLDSSFHGSSRSCETFESPSFVSSDGYSFSVQSIELFCFPACKAHAEHLHTHATNPKLYKSLLSQEEENEISSKKKSVDINDTKYNQYNNTLQGADARHMLAQFRHECGAFGRHVLNSDADSGNHCNPIYEKFPETVSEKRDNTPFNGIFEIKRGLTEPSLLNSSYMT